MEGLWLKGLRRPKRFLGFYFLHKGSLSEGLRAYDVGFKGLGFGVTDLLEFVGLRERRHVLTNKFVNPN